MLTLPGCLKTLLIQILTSTARHAHSALGNGEHGAGEEDAVLFTASPADAGSGSRLPGRGRLFSSILLSCLPPHGAISEGLAPALSEVPPAPALARNRPGGGGGGGAARGRGAGARTGAACGGT